MNCIWGWTSYEASHMLVYERNGWNWMNARETPIKLGDGQPLYLCKHVLFSLACGHAFLREDMIGIFAKQFVIGSCTRRKLQ